MNIYKRARESAGYTQERAAELIGCSVDSLKSYESERRLPSDQVVIIMVDIYQAHFLAYQHLKYKSDIGKYLLPDADYVPLSQATLRLLHYLKLLLDKKERLTEISMDGVIDQTEQMDWDSITKSIEKLIASLFQVKLSKEGE